MYMSECVAAPHVFGGHKGKQNSIRSFETGATNGYKPPCDLQITEPGPLERAATTLNCQPTSLEFTLQFFMTGSLPGAD